MKKFLAVAAVLAVTSANAEELKFGDLNYFLKQGQFNFSVDANISREVSTVNDVKVEAEGYVFSPRLTYGLSDQLNLFVGANFLYDFETLPEGGSNAESDGLQNPYIGANYRVMNQNNGGFNLDVGAVADFNIMDSETSQFGKEDGNIPAFNFSQYGDPRSSLEINARLGNKWNEANEYYFLAAARYNKDGEYEDGNANEDVELDSSIDYTLGAFYQYRPVMEFMLTLGLSATRFGEVDGEVAGSDFTEEDHIDYRFHFNAKYLITETFIAKFNFSQDRRAEYESELAGDDMEKRKANSFGLGVDWLF